MLSLMIGAVVLLLALSLVILFLVAKRTEAHTLKDDPQPQPD